MDHPCGYQMSCIGRWIECALGRDPEKGPIMIAADELGGSERPSLGSDIAACGLSRVMPGMH
jgi:hypothetical protein